MAIKRNGANGKETEAAVQEVQYAGPAVQAIRVVTDTIRETSVHNRSQSVSQTK